MEELERELLSMVARELGEFLIMVCRSKLCSESGEMGRGRFLLGRDGSLGLGKRELSMACRYSMCRALAVLAPAVDATEGRRSVV